MCPYSRSRDQSLPRRSIVRCNRARKAAVVYQLVAISIEAKYRLGHRRGAIAVEIHAAGADARLTSDVRVHSGSTLEKLAGSGRLSGDHHSSANQGFEGPVAADIQQKLVMRATCDPMTR